MFVFVVEARQLCAEAEEFIAKAVQVLLLVEDLINTFVNKFKTFFL